MRQGTSPSRTEVAGSLYTGVAIDPRYLIWPDSPRIELLQPARQVLSWCKQRRLRWLVPVRKALQ
jgi:hypothetical protein